jgi:Zn-dependent protease with chaperone function
MAILAVIAFRKVKETTGILLARVSDLKQKEKLHDIVKGISSYAGVREPLIAVKNSNLIAGFAAGLFPFCSAIVLTRKAVDSLKEDELEALVAHEIAHLKRHSFVFGFLNFISEWTLFGKGFLAVLLDTKRIEFEADDFSLAWLKKRGFQKEVLMNLLNKTMAVNAMSRYLAVSKPLFAFDETGNEDMGGDKMSFRKKLSLLYEVYFGDFIIPYIHPSIEERVRRIEAYV